MINNQPTNQTFKNRTIFFSFYKIWNVYGNKKIENSLKSNWQAREKEQIINIWKTESKNEKSPLFNSMSVQLM